MQKKRRRTSNNNTINKIRSEFDVVDVNGKSTDFISEKKKHNIIFKKKKKKDIG